MLKEVLKRYLDAMMEYYQENEESYPRMDAAITDEPSICFVGEKDADGYIQWKYAERPNLIDFDEIEGETQIPINEEVKQFYNSYLFLDLYGFLDNEVIEFFPVTDEVEDIYFLCDEYPGFILIGTYGNIPLSLCVDAQSGKVYTWDCSEDTYEFEFEHRFKEPELLANSLSDLFSRLSLVRK